MDVSAPARARDESGFDRSLLAGARYELVVISDTHYLLHPELQGGEWKSILEFPARAERALRLAGALEADFVVHLGDVTHEYPETGEAGVSRPGADAAFRPVRIAAFNAAAQNGFG